MADVSWVNDRLAIGGAVDSLIDARAIENKGITHVLNLRSGDRKPADVMDEAKWFTRIGLTYLNNPTHDDGEKKSVDWFKPSLDFTLHALVADPRNKVLIHCKDGINRSPSTAYAVLRAIGVPRKDAYEHVMEARPKAECAYRDDADRALAKLGY